MHGVLISYYTVDFLKSSHGSDCETTVRHSNNQLNPETKTNKKRNNFLPWKH